MTPDSIIFDLDGTLWDTCATCAIAWNRVLNRFGIDYREIGAEDVRAVTGKPHLDCIRLTFHDLPNDEISRICDATMIEDNLAIEELGGNLYEGVSQGLSLLRERYPLFIVSNCQSGYIETFLRMHGFELTISDFECWGNTGRPKGENLKSLIARNGLVSPVMIGDADGDETAARECRIPFAFVQYGFGKSVSPDLSFSCFQELVNHFVEIASAAEERH